MAESIEELLYTAATDVLTGDTSNTGNTVREINYYVSDRVQRENINADIDYPRIDLEVEVVDTQVALPSGNYFLVVTPKVKMNAEYAQTTLDRITARCIELLDKQPGALNLAANVSGKNLRVRFINKLSALRTPDVVAEIFQKTIQFRVIVDNDVL